MKNKFYVMAEGVDFAIYCLETKQYYTSEHYGSVIEIETNAGIALLQQELELNPNYQGTLEDKMRGLTLTLFTQEDMLADAKKNGDKSPFVELEMVLPFELDTESCTDDYDPSELPD